MHMLGDRTNFATIDPTSSLYGDLVDDTSARVEKARNLCAPDVCKDS